MTEQPVIETAKARKVPIVTEFERRGVRARYSPVPVGIVQDALSRIQTPAVPTWHNPDKDRDEENPNDPAYIRLLEAYDTERGRVTAEAMTMFGIELLDGLPEDDRWIEQLKFLDKRKILDLSWVDWEDEIDLEFLFKRYILVNATDLARIGANTGLTEEGIAQARASFQRD